MTQHIELTKSEKINLDIKDIAKAIRAELKKKYSDCKFAVNIERYSGGQSMTVALMEAPFEALTEQCCGRNYGQLNHFYIKDESTKSVATPEARKVMGDVVDTMKGYNFDESDSMTDYFHVNFYMHIAIGKWNKDFKNTMKEVA